MEKMKQILLAGMVTVLILTQNWSNSQAEADTISFALNNEIQSIVLNEPALKGSLAGISIRDQQSGNIVYEHIGNIRLAPASNMKLLTAAVALSVLGEDYRFSTEVATDGKIKNNILHGNLYLKGKGDTTLMADDLDQLARTLKNKGIQKVTGSLIYDTSWYDSIPLSVDLAWSDEATYYGAKISPLTVSPTKEYDAGTVLIKTAPAKKMGASAILTAKPATNAITIINKTKTVEKQGKKKLRYTREHDGKKIIVSGTIPIDASADSEWISVFDPSKVAADLFQQSLTKQGIQTYGIHKGVTPELSTLMASQESIPLSKLLIPFMKLSNNTIAETLLKEIGKVKRGKGSFEAGIAVVKEELKKFGLNPDHMLIRDGSGISPIDFVTANDLSLLLFHIQKKPWFPVYLTSLPVSGNTERLVGGTLRYRLHSENTKGKVRAKTGSLSAVSTLSGYVESRSGKKYIFSILLNHLVDDDKGKQIQDKIVETLAAY
ncbi:D-alanyl-D-alanine carboxypeptidase/D-alanyl-D-alanine endopeptidase [Niallia nealsonii]|uniref:D-alanyl-D-alanine carboxypeptidase/D-alanyl-D-alanine-endopeptidase n=1 Tax=Niallia nealsonii TaxID=115979 RepID=A0A2N0Z0E5_9BACI|nr:D-alanyl-D-alanine carboxypeptidase/D-alanyl-D-alanine-endopeptidase [Niallia nealsonii]PKG22958.1 D-alanyl-D-alanine carboxypeptidase/D-alanyl-D-alanine-endopeptidase [Niallia nealsonii]